MMVSRLMDHRSVLFSREGCAEILQRHPQKVSVQKASQKRSSVLCLRHTASCNCIGGEDEEGCGV